MTAYASLLSLGHILDQLLQQPRHQMAILDNGKIDYLLENITFLQDFLEDFSLLKGDEIQALEAKITRSSYAAEDFIEKCVVDQILENTEFGSESSSTMWKVIAGFDSIKKDVLKIKKTEGMKIMEQPRKSATAGSFIRGVSMVRKNGRGTAGTGVPERERQLPRQSSKLKRLCKYNTVFLEISAISRSSRNGTAISRLSRPLRNVFCNFYKLFLIF